MIRRAFGCAALLLLLAGQGVCAQSIVPENATRRAAQEHVGLDAAAAVGLVTAATRRTGSSVAGRSAAPARHRHMAEIYALVAHVYRQHLPGPTRDPVYDVVYADPVDTEHLLTDSRLLQEARELVQSVTSIEGDGYLLQIDPLKPRCTLRIQLFRNEATPADSTESAGPHS